MRLISGASSSRELTMPPYHPLFTPCAYLWKQYSFPPKRHWPRLVCLHIPSTSIMPLLIGALLINKWMNEWFLDWTLLLLSRLYFSFGILPSKSCLVTAFFLPHVQSSSSWHSFQYADTSAMLAFMVSGYIWLPIDHHLFGLSCFTQSKAYLLACRKMVLIGKAELLPWSSLFLHFQSFPLSQF